MLRTLDTDGIRPFGDEQRRFAEWFLDNREELDALTDLEALASDSHETLNSFLVERRFDPMFRPFRGIGVASVLDMLVEWSAKAEKTSIGTYAGDTWRNFSAFEIPQSGVEFFVVPGSHDPLIRIDTRSGHGLWLIKTNAPTTAFDLPFLGFFTQPGHPVLPLAAFYAGFDPWRTPEGTLDEL